MRRKQQNGPFRFQQCFQPFQTPNGRCVPNGGLAAKPQQAAVDDGLRQQPEVASKQGAALLITEFRESQCQVGAHNMRTLAQQPRSQPRQCTGPAASARKTEVNTMLEKAVQQP